MLYRRPKGRTYDDERAVSEAAKLLPRLPEPGEDLHLWIPAKFGSWAIVRNIIDRRLPQTITELWIATLSFSKTNAEQILDMLDSGTVKKVGLVVSHYFKASNREIYDALVPKLIARNMPVVAIRNHAKVCLMQTSDGTYYTIQGSANLRSNQNVEQTIITNDEPTYRFHRKVIATDLLKYEDETLY